MPIRPKAHMVPLVYLVFYRGKSGEEPPVEIKKLYEWFETMQTTIDEEREPWLEGNLAFPSRESVIMGTVGLIPQPCLVSNNSMYPR